VVPKLWFAYHWWCMKDFKAVRETLLFFYTKRIQLINSCIFVYFP